MNPDQPTTRAATVRKWSVIRRATPSEPRPQGSDLAFTAHTSDPPVPIRIPALLRAHLVAALLLVCSFGCSVPTSTTDVDTDTDGVSDERELLLGTDPANTDSDDDGLLDGDELDSGSSPLTPDSDNDGLTDGDDSVLGPPSRITGPVSTGNDIEPNGSFETAVVRSGVLPDRFALEGKVDFLGDIDVFDIGALQPGDHITVNFDPLAGRFQPRLAIFDESESLFRSVKDISSRGGTPITRFVDNIVRHSSERYYVAVTNPDELRTIGSYQFEITVTRNSTIPQPQPQIVYLDFDGGTLDISLLGVSTVPAFDAGLISTVYQGTDTTMISGIIATIEENYAAYDLVILTSLDSPSPNSPVVSRLLFGSFSATVFGVSQGVDAYNLNQCDDGIIFTESFTPQVFGFTPNADDVAVAIGNVAAHEIGHLLGLNHVTDATAIMDAASPAPFLLEDQEFKIAPLAEAVFPLGIQDDPTLLDEILGPISN